MRAVQGRLPSFLTLNLEKPTFLATVQVDLDAILDIGAYDLERAMKIDPELFALPIEVTPHPASGYS